MKFSLIDKAIIHFDALLNTRSSSINYPAQGIENMHPLSNQELRESISMMRINHSGEVCAQALYHGQALMARDQAQYQSLLQAANEENEHLNWCKTRLKELNGRTSFLNPFWYTGSMAIGMFAGLAGDRISLGFLAETEYQVTAHLDRHIRNLSYKDAKSRCILMQMRNDELKHATNAVSAGAAKLPSFIKFAMRCTAKVLTITAGRI